METHFLRERNEEQEQFNIQSRQAGVLAGNRAAWRAMRDERGGMVQDLDGSAEIVLKILLVGASKSVRCSVCSKKTAINAVEGYVCCLRPEAGGAVIVVRRISHLVDQSCIVRICSREACQFGVLWRSYGSATTLIIAPKAWFISKDIANSDTRQVVSASAELHRAC